jgi:hypothetical protein
MALAIFLLPLLHAFGDVLNYISSRIIHEAQEKGQARFLLLSMFLQSSELFGEALSLSLLAPSSASKPSSPMTFSPVPPFCRSLRACAHPIAVRDKSLPSAPRSPRLSFAASTLDRLGIPPRRCLHDLVETRTKEPPRFRFLFFHAGLVPEPLFDPSYEFLPNTGFWYGPW